MFKTKIIKEKRKDFGSRHMITDYAAVASHSSTEETLLSKSEILFKNIGYEIKYSIGTYRG